MSGKWIKNRGCLMSPCDGAGCKRIIERGEWYWRDRMFVLCQECAVNHGVTDV